MGYVEGGAVLPGREAGSWSARGWVNVQVGAERERRRQKVKPPPRPPTSPLAAKELLQTRDATPESSSFARQRGHGGVLAFEDGPHLRLDGREVAPPAVGDGLYGGVRLGLGGIGGLVGLGEGGRADGVCLGRTGLGGLGGGSGFRCAGLGGVGAGLGGGARGSLDLEGLYQARPLGLCRLGRLGCRDPLPLGVGRGLLPREALAPRRRLAARRRLLRRRRAPRLRLGDRGAPFCHCGLELPPRLSRRRLGRRRRLGLGLVPSPPQRRKPAFPRRPLPI